MAKDRVLRGVILSPLEHSRAYSLRIVGYIIQI